MSIVECERSNDSRRIFMRRSIKVLACTMAAKSTVFAWSQEMKPEAAVPKFHDHVPLEPLPSVRDGKEYADRPTIQRVYELAATVRPVLYQLPCYCACDRVEGHNSLLDCFVGTHGVECKICRREVVFAVRKTRQGQKSTQIREAIIRKEWTQEDVDDLEKLPPVTASS